MNVSFSYGIPDGFFLDELVAFLQKVASEAPEVPFYYYHIPPLTGVKSKYRVQILWLFALERRLNGVFEGMGLYSVLNVLLPVHS